MPFRDRRPIFHGPAPWHQLGLPVPIVRAELCRGALRYPAGEGALVGDTERCVEEVEGV